MADSGAPLPSGQSSPLPFISALCIAGKDEFTDRTLLPVAISCFLSQTWPDDRRELVIVTDGETPPVDYGSGVLWVCLPRDGAKLSLGALRNISLENSHGDLQVQWDADDWHHPRRLELQARVCMEYPGKACFLQRQLCYSFSHDTAFVRDYFTMPIHGTICHPRCDVIRYPELPKEEDTVYFRSWAEKGMVIADNDPALYVRIEHGHNTWDARHILHGYASSWARHCWFLGDWHRDFLRRILPQYVGLYEPELHTTQQPQEQQHADPQPQRP